MAVNLNKLEPTLGVFFICITMCINRSSADAFKVTYSSTQYTSHITEKYQDKQLTIHNACQARP